MNKLGKLLLFIGLILLVVFFAINQAENPTYGYFCFGIITVILGVLFIRRSQPPPPDESMRFRTVRRWREQQRARKAEKNNKPNSY